MILAKGIHLVVIVLSPSLEKINHLGVFLGTERII